MKGRMFDTALCLMVIASGCSLRGGIPPNVTESCHTYHGPLGTHVNCSNRSLKDIPINLPLNTSVLILSDNFISKVRNNSFNKLQKMRYLDLHNNTVTNLEMQALNGCVNLRVLDLSKNRINFNNSSMPTTVFDGLQMLESLNLKYNDDNKSVEYPDRIFRNLINLQSLYIDALKEQYFGPGFGNLNKLQKLYLGGNGCRMVTLSNWTFLSLENSSLEVLDLSGCHSLETLEPETFAPLKNLKKLHMRDCSVGLKKSLESLSSLPDQMTVIDLYNVQVQFAPGLDKVNDGILDKNSLSNLARICVERLVLGKNHILYVDALSLNNTNMLSCIRYLDVSYNRLYGDRGQYYSAFTRAVNLTFLDISVQEFGQKTPFVPPVQSSILSLKYGDRRDPHLIEIPPYLRFVNISTIDSNLGAIPCNITVLNGHSLLELNASFIGLTHAPRRLEGLVNLAVLDLSGNSQLQLSDSFFDTFPSLETLHLSFFSFQQNTANNQGRRLFHPLPKLRSLYINYNQLSHLPSNLFDSNPHLEYLDVSRNTFSVIPIDLMWAPRLQVLDMTFNSLGSINSQTRADVDAHFARLQGKFCFLLKANIFSCGCGSLEFMFWLTVTETHLDNGRNYTCLLENGEASNTIHVVENIQRLWRKCIGFRLMYLSSTLMTLFLASVISALFIKTNKTAIIHTLINLLRRNVNKTQRNDYRKDVFVAYAEADYQWVCHQLCPALEERNVRLYIWDRDSVPGDSIPDQIAENICESWKTLIYFTEKYERDTWMYVSMMSAINGTDVTNPERILLFLKDDDHPYIPNCLLEVIPESCIFRVPAGVCNDDDFWDDVTKVILERNC